MPLHEVCESHPCVNCPTVKLVRNRAEMLDTVSIELMDKSTNPEVFETLAEQLAEGAGAPIDEARSLVNNHRGDLLDMMNGGLAAISKEQRTIDETVDEIIDGCPGPLRMRATDKLGRVVTATVCGSRKIILHDGPEVVTIDRRQP